MQSTLLRYLIVCAYLIVCVLLGSRSSLAQHWPNEHCRMECFPMDHCYSYGERCDYDCHEVCEGPYHPYGPWEFPDVRAVRPVVTTTSKNKVFLNQRVYKVNKSKSMKIRMHRSMKSNQPMLQGFYLAQGCMA